MQLAYLFRRVYRLIIDVYLSVPVCHDQDPAGLVMHQVLEPSRPRCQISDHLEIFHISQLKVAVLRYRIYEPERSVRIDTHDSLGVYLKEFSLEG